MAVQLVDGFQSCNYIPWINACIVWSILHGLRSDACGLMMLYIAIDQLCDVPYVEQW